MSAPPNGALLHAPSPDPAREVALAKAALMDWAQACDARRPKSRGVAFLLIAGGVLGCVTGIGVSRLRGPPRRVASGRRAVPWTFLARAGFWLLPIAVQAVRRSRPNTGGLP